MKQLVRAALVMVAACGGSDKPAADAAASDGAVSDSTINNVFAKGTVTDQSTGAPIAGAQVCAAGLAAAGPCDTSGSDGSYSFTAVVPKMDIDLSSVALVTGYLGEVQLIHETSAAVAWPDTVALYSDTDATTFFGSDAGFTYPSTTTGFVHVVVFGTTAGVALAATATLSPASGSGPVYANGNGHPDPALTATSPSGEVLFGNVAPGNYELTIAAPGKTCTALAHGEPVAGNWAPTGGSGSGSGSDPSTLSLVVVADALTTEMTVQCM